MRDAADEYLSARNGGALRFCQVSMNAHGDVCFGLGVDGCLYEAVWSDGAYPQVEGWRAVNMSRYEEEYVDS